MVRIVVDSILPHAECGSNDHRKDAPPFTRGNSRLYQVCDKNAFDKMYEKMVLGTRTILFMAQNYSLYNIKYISKNQYVLI